MARAWTIIFVLVYGQITFLSGSGKSLYFPSDTPCLHMLPVPNFLASSAGVCDKACQEREKKALKEFFMSTGGNQWDNSTGWMKLHQCQWFGIICYNQTKNVIAINLPRNGLNGYFHKVLGDLKLLLGLCVSRNRIRGDLNIILSTVSKHFLRLDFTHCDIAGKISFSTFREFRNLRKLQLEGNEMITGEITDSIASMTNLSALTLGSTDIKGRLPPSLGKLINLATLDLQNLQLEGELETLENMTILQYLHLSGNRLKGRLSANIGSQHQKLVELQLRNNFIEGTIPKSISNLSQLTFFDVSNNNMSGEIPVELGNLQRLQVFTISKNSFSGFEHCFKFQTKHLGVFTARFMKNMKCSMTRLLHMLIQSKDSLMRIEVEGSGIQGSLPERIFEFKKMTFLNLKSNNITGFLPEPEERVRFLTNIDLSNNSIKGTIPSSFVRLQSVSLLDLRRNPNLKGKIGGTFLHSDLNRLYKNSVLGKFFCPEVRFLHNDGVIRLSPDYYARRICVCGVSFFGVGGNCVSCLAGGVCHGIASVNLSKYARSVSGPRSQKTIVTVMQLNRNYWPFPSPDDVEALVECSFAHPDEVCNHDGRCTCYREKRNGTVSGYLTKCNRNCTCRPGHGGRLCSECKKGYYLDGKICRICPGGQSKAVHLTIIVGIPLVIGAILGIVYWLSSKRLKTAIAIVIFENAILLLLGTLKVIPGWIAKFCIFINVLAFGSHGKSCAGFVKIFVFYSQMFGALWTPINSAKLSSGVNGYLVSGALNLEFSSLACHIPSLFTATAKYGILYSLPIDVAIILSIYYFIRFRNSESETRRAEGLKCLGNSLMFCNFMYFPIADLVFEVLVPCQNVSSSSQTISYMANFAWIDCAGRDYTILRVLSFIALILYVIAVPYVIYVYLLYKNKEDIENDDEKVEEWLGSLYKTYKPSYRLYMEIVVVTKRLFIAIVITFTLQESTARTSLVILILLISLMLEVHTKPFESQGGNFCLSAFPRIQSIGLENILSVVSQVVLVVAFAVSQCHSIGSNFAMFWIIFAVNTCFQVLFLIVVLLQLCSSI